MKKLLFRIIPLIIFILIAGSFIYFLISRKPVKEQPIFGEKTVEEILQNLTAPINGEQSKVSEEILKLLTAPGKGGDIIKSLTVPK